MMRELRSLSEILVDFDAIVFDQWGVLHYGRAPYPGAVATIAALAMLPIKLAVLSNSGKRSSLNITRIAALGFNPHDFLTVMTSGEALWQDFNQGAFPQIKNLYPISATHDDAKLWANGLISRSIVDDINKADAVLLMGLTDDITDSAFYNAVLGQALKLGLPLFCSNPDKASPRADHLVISSGLLAQHYADEGGSVQYYGKPYPLIFSVLAHRLDVTASRILMIGDSLEHDIKGARAAGWKSLFITNGIHAVDYKGGVDRLDVTRHLAKAHDVEMPDFIMERISL